MPSITPSKNDSALLKGAKKETISFILNYSKSYRVIEVAERKIGLNLN